MFCVLCSVLCSIFIHTTHSLFHFITIFRRFFHNSLEEHNTLNSVMDWRLMFKQIYFWQSRILSSPAQHISRCIPFSVPLPLSLRISLAPSQPPSSPCVCIMHTREDGTRMRGWDTTKSSSKVQKILTQKMRGHYYIDIVSLFRCSAKCIMYNIIKLVYGNVRVSVFWGRAATRCCTVLAVCVELC